VVKVLAEVLTDHAIAPWPGRPHRLLTLTSLT
jgi:hypothetical protein